MISNIVQEKVKENIASGLPPAPPLLDSVNFNGFDQFFYKGENLNGNVDGSIGMCSFWLRLNGGDGVSQSIFESVNGAIQIQRVVANRIGISLYGSGGLLAVVQTASNFLASPTWLHVLASWDTTNQQYEMYINDALEQNHVPFNAGTILYSTGAFTIGKRSTSSSSFLNGCLSDLYINMTEKLDFSIEANRRLFTDANGNRISLGSQGQLPTGNPPIIYMNGNENTFHLNLGSGGPFINLGSVIGCDNEPPS